MLERVKHSGALPQHLTSHQMVTVSQDIHRLVSRAVEPLLEANPHFQSIALTLGTVQTSVDTLKRSQTRRKFKAVRDLRGVNGNGGNIGEQRFSQRKMRITTKRRTHMRRLEREILWQYKDLVLDRDDNSVISASEEKIEAVKLLYQLVQLRIKDFARLSYEEAAAEFTHFFESIDGNPDAEAALAVLAMTDSYEQIKTLHEEYQLIASEQTERDAEGEEIPKLDVAMRDVRRSINVLLTLLHFDIENGSSAFTKVLAHVDEIIDKARAVGKRRKTLDEQEEASSQAPSEGDSDNGSDSSSDSSSDTGSGSDSSASTGESAKGETPQAGNEESPATKEVTQG